MRQGTLFFSDLHLGASREHFDLAKKSFAEMPNLAQENGITITKAVNLGDSIDRWINGDGLENPFDNNEVIQAFRGIYKNIFQENKPVILACPGNHENDIIDRKVAVTPEKAYQKYCKAIGKIREFTEKALSEAPDSSVEVFGGLKQLEGDVLVHHGDFLDTKAFEKLLSGINKEMSTEEKIAVINSDKEVYAQMQKKWQKFQKYLWPALRIMPIKALTGPLVLTKKLGGLDNEFGKGGRSLSEIWSNPIAADTLLQFRLLSVLFQDPEKRTVVSGHSHTPGIVSNPDGFKGTVVALGSWHDTACKPMVGIQTEYSGAQEFLFCEFNNAVGKNGKWAVRNNVKMNR